MLQEFRPGDYLIFQIESGFGLLRVLAVDDGPDETVWHLAAYDDLYLDAEMADAALDGGSRLKVSQPHLALTNRAFESTQTALMRNVPLSSDELAALEEWRADPDRVVSDRSVRLLLGLR